MLNKNLLAKLKKCIEQFNIDEGIYNYSLKNEYLKSLKEMDEYRKSLFGVDTIPELMNLLEGRCLLATEKLNIKGIYDAAGLPKNSYYAYKKEEIKMSRKIALALGLAYHLDEEDFAKFMFFFGFNFPSTYTDAVVMTYIKSEEYKKHSFEYKNRYKITESFPVVEVNEYISELKKEFRNNRYIKLEFIGSGLGDCENVN